MGLWGLNHYIIINTVWAGTFGIFLNTSFRARGSPSKVSFYIWGSFQGPLKDRFHVCGFILFSLVILSGTFLEHPVKRLLAFLMCSCPGTCTSRATTRWSVPRREPVVCILWKRWKRDHHLPFFSFSFSRTSSQPSSPWTPIQVQAIIIASYAEPVTAEQCAVVTEKLGDYLVSVGYWTFLLHIFANFWCSAFGPFHKYVDIGSIIGHPCSVYVL